MASVIISPNRVETEKNVENSIRAILTKDSNSVESKQFAILLDELRLQNPLDNVIISAMNMFPKEPKMKDYEKISNEIIYELLSDDIINEGRIMVILILAREIYKLEPLTIDTLLLTITSNKKIMDYIIENNSLKKIFKNCMPWNLYIRNLKE